MLSEERRAELMARLEELHGEALGVLVRQPDPLAERAAFWASYVPKKDLCDVLTRSEKASIVNACSLLFGDTARVRCRQVLGAACNITLDLCGVSALSEVYTARRRLLAGRYAFTDAERVLGEANWRHRDLFRGDR